MDTYETTAIEILVLLPLMICGRSPFCLLGTLRNCLCSRPVKSLTNSETLRANQKPKSYGHLLALSLNALFILQPHGSGTRNSYLCQTCAYITREPYKAEEIKTRPPKIADEADFGTVRLIAK